MTVFTAGPPSARKRVALAWGGARHRLAAPDLIATLAMPAGPTPKREAFPLGRAKEAG